MSTARLEWLRASLDIDSDEIGTYNSFLNSHYQNEYNSNEAEKERQWNEKMSDKEFERQKELIALEAQYNRSYGGGGYYSYGGSGYSRSGGSSSGFSPDVTNYLDKIGSSLNHYELAELEKYLIEHPNASLSDIKKILDKTRPVKNAAKNATKIAGIKSASNAVKSVTDAVKNAFPSLGGTSPWY